MIKKQKSTEAGDSQVTPVRKVQVDAGSAGQRIDNFLRRELAGVPKGRLYRLLRRGEVRVNGGRVRAEYKLAEGDEVRIPPVRIRTAGPAPVSDVLARVADRVLHTLSLSVVTRPWTRMLGTQPMRSGS